jgi:hypothetical protein
MGGRHVRLDPGRYTLDVAPGEGPAGIQREDGTGVRLDVDGGRLEFEVYEDEPVYFWWRGPEHRPGVRLLGVSETEPVTSRAETWPTGTTG